MYFKYVPERLYKDLGPNLKILFSLRNPVNRAYSHYLMSKRRQIETESFKKAIDLESERIKLSEYNKNHFSYINRGLYAIQIKRYLNFFPKDNLFFLVFEEDFIENRKLTISKILKFLEVEDMDLKIDIQMNPARFIRING